MKAKPQESLKLKGTYMNIGKQNYTINVYITELMN